jgi:hypothetical protein
MARGDHGLPKVSPAPRHAPPFYARQVGYPQNGLKAASGVTHPQGRRPATIFYPLEHPMMYASVNMSRNEATSTIFALPRAFARGASSNATHQEF